MAIVSAATFKTEIATAATALTVAYKDSAGTALPLEITNPHHPLRQIEKLFLFNGATGVITSDDTYIDNAYAGEFPTKGNPFDVVAGFLSALVTATVEDAAPTLIVLTYPDNFDPNSKPAITDFVVGGTQSYLITNVAIAGKVVTLTSASAFIMSDTITMTYTVPANKPLTLLKDRRIAAALAAQAVTNNVT